MDERRCENCNEVFTPRRNTKGRFCSHACYVAAGPGPRRLKTLTKPRQQTAKGHPLAPPSGIVSVSRLVLFSKIGPGEHPCHWCGEAVRWIVGGGPSTPGSLLADHLDWNNQNDAPENLVPSCNQCNSHRTKSGGRSPLLEEDLTIVWSGARTRAVRRNCETCGEGFLTIPQQVRIGKGRFCSRSCARRAPRSA